MSQPRDTSPRPAAEFEIIFTKLQEPAARATIVAVQAMSEATSASAEVSRLASDEPVPVSTFFSS
jgi:hypothetical protein